MFKLVNYLDIEAIKKAPIAELESNYWELVELSIEIERQIYSKKQEHIVKRDRLKKALASVKYQRQMCLDIWGFRKGLDLGLYK